MTHLNDASKKSASYRHARNFSHIAAVGQSLLKADDYAIGMEKLFDSLMNASPL